MARNGSPKPLAAVQARKMERIQTRRAFTNFHKFHSQVLSNPVCLSLSRWLDSDGHSALVSLCGLAAELRSNGPSGPSENPHRSRYPCNSCAGISAWAQLGPFKSFAALLKGWSEVVVKEMGCTERSQPQASFLVEHGSCGHHLRREDIPSLAVAFHRNLLPCTGHTAVDGARAPRTPPPGTLHEETSAEVDPSSRC